MEEKKKTHRQQHIYTEKPKNFILSILASFFATVEQVLGRAVVALPLSISTAITVCQNMKTEGDNKKNEIM